MSDIYKRLVELKNSSGMSGTQLATMFGISSTSFTDWGKGKGKPSVETLTKFAEYFNVSMDWIVFGKETIKSPVEELEFSISEEDKLLLKKYHYLTPELQAQVLAYIDGILSVISSTTPPKTKSNIEKERLSS